MESVVPATLIALVLLWTACTDTVTEPAANSVGSGASCDVAVSPIDVVEATSATSPELPRLTTAPGIVAGSPPADKVWLFITITPGDSLFCEATTVRFPAARVTRPG